MSDMADAPTGDASAPPMIEVRDLSVSYRTADGAIPAARGVDLDLRAGEILALVGESACGKSTVGHAILDLLPPTAEVTGSIRLAGRSLLGLSEDELRQLRGREIGAVFQDAHAALTPTLTVGEQMAEPFLIHRGMTPEQAREAARHALEQVIPDPDRIMNTYPFQLSGGMAQRVMIAMATALEPRVVIADEPTANLDPAVRQETLEWLESLRARGAAIMVITHDFGVVARLADRVAVMYAGRVMETADVRAIFRIPRHPYTFGLLQSLPSLARRGRLTPMEGLPPDLSTLPPECPFLPRCNKATATCRAEPAPPLRPMGDAADHLAACFNPIVVPLRD